MQHCVSNTPLFSLTKKNGYIGVIILLTWYRSILIISIKDNYNINNVSLILATM